MDFKVAVFDLDGTLLDTLEDLTRAVNKVLERHDFPQHPSSVYKHYIGDGMGKLVERSLPENYRTGKFVEECLEKVRHEYAQGWDLSTEPYPGIPELLTALQQRGVKLAILSNKKKEFIQLTVDKFLSQWKFEVIIGDEEAFPRKPEPDGAYHIARTLNLTPEEMVYVGDTGTDMQTGVNAGMFTVGALWGFRDYEELKVNGADLLIERPEDLLQLF